MWTLPRSADLAPRQGTHDARIGGGRDDSGAAAVEFALVVPILLALVFGIVNFGFIFTAQISMNAGARDAARAGVVSATGTALSCGDIANRARASLITFGAASNAVVVTVRKAVTSTAGSGTDVCQAVGTSAPVSIGSENVNGQPCTATAQGSALQVRIAYAYKSLVPLVPPQNMNLTSTGTFRCEYS